MRSLLTSLHNPKYFNSNGTPKELVACQIFRMTMSRGWFSLPTIVEASEMPIIEGSEIRYVDLNGKRCVFTRQQNDRVRIRKTQVLKEVSFTKEHSHDP